ncbi:MAG: anhydro-N-acetylmuramic acid kinase [Chrysiogenetes bacterium]|nr:anhydro-N-acetylmuramic acid kinase [Chrysiogenetes bacterium]
MLWIGLLSGTSVDGIDAALARIDTASGGAPRIDKLLAFETFPYPEEVRGLILELCHASNPALDDVLRLDALLGELFAVAAAEIATKGEVNLEDVAAIGSHGQTVRHVPDARTAQFEFAGAVREFSVRSTFQIADPAIIAERTGVDTVARLRHRDMAAGGEGAPLAPVLHLSMLGERDAFLVNIGGIANVTIPGMGPGKDGPIAFDTGPGNMLMDALVKDLTGGAASYDHGGKMAAAGSVNEALLAELLQHPYFERKAPKSTGREDFGDLFAQKILQDAGVFGLSPEDILATATALSAESIARSLAPYRKERPSADHLYVCGGGAHNPALLDELARRVPGISIRSVDAIGYDPDSVEALLFAWLAACHVAKWPGNLPSVTGATHPVILGEFIPGRKPK